jgi:hypothetical protein
MDGEERKRKNATFSLRAMSAIAKFKSGECRKGGLR